MACMLVGRKAVHSPTPDQRCDPHPTNGVTACGQAAIKGSKGKREGQGREDRAGQGQGRATKGRAVKGEKAAKGRAGQLVRL